MRRLIMLPSRISITDRLREAEYGFTGYLSTGGRGEGDQARGLGLRQLEVPALRLRPQQ